MNSKKIIYNYILLTIFFHGNFVCAETTGKINDITSKVEKAYADLDSYKDMGIVKTDIMELEFETYYLKPDLFLLKWKDTIYLNSIKKYKLTSKNQKYPNTKYHAIWGNDDGFFANTNYKGSLKHKNKIRKLDSLFEILNRTHGTSLGSSTRILKYFFPTYDGWRIRDLINLEIYEDEFILGHKCYHISGELKHYEGLAKLKKVFTLMHIWIDKDTYKIRKIVDTKIGATTYFTTIVTNEKIPLSVFDFKPD